MKKIFFTLLIVLGCGVLTASVEPPNKIDQLLEAFQSEATNEEINQMLENNEEQEGSKLVQLKRVLAYAKSRNDANSAAQIMKKICKEELNFVQKHPKITVAASVLASLVAGGVGVLATTLGFAMLLGNAFKR